MKHTTIISEAHSYITELGQRICCVAPLVVAGSCSHLMLPSHAETRRSLCAIRGDLIESVSHGYSGPCEALFPVMVPLSGYRSGGGGRRLYRLPY